MYFLSEELLEAARVTEDEMADTEKMVKESEADVTGFLSTYGLYQTYSASWMYYTTSSYATPSPMSTNTNTNTTYSWNSAYYSF